MIHFEEALRLLHLPPHPTYSQIEEAFLRYHQFSQDQLRYTTDPAAQKAIQQHLDRLEEARTFLLAAVPPSAGGRLPPETSQKPRKMGCFLPSMIGCGTLLILMIVLPILMEMLNRYRFQGCPARDAEVCAALRDCKHSSTPPKQAGVACWKAAAAFHRIGTAETMQQALTLYQKACTHDIPQACNNMGYLLQTYIQASPSYPFPQTALSSFQRACRLQDPQGCNNLATLHEQRASKETKQRAEHHKIAEDSYQKACSLRNAQACRNLGLFRERWRPRARQSIGQAYQEACRLGDAGGCRNLGFFYEQDNSDPARCKKAAPPYRRACKLGDRPLCGYRCVSNKPRKQEDEP